MLLKNFFAKNVEKKGEEKDGDKHQKWVLQWSQQVKNDSDELNDDRKMLRNGKKKRVKKNA